MLSKYDSIAAITKDYNFAWIKKKNKMIPVNFSPKVVTKTQNLNPIIQSNGAFLYSKNFLKYNNRIGKNHIIMKLIFLNQLKLILKKI